MGYVNIFQKLDQDIANKLQQLEAQQKELLEKKKSLQNIKEDIQKFLDSAQEIKVLVESEPDLLKSLRLELGKIFSMQTPTLPIQRPENITPSKPENTTSVSEESITPSKPENTTPISEEHLEQKSSAKSSLKSLIFEDEESIINSTFVDAQGHNKSFN